MKTWSDENKLYEWQRVELAVIEARVRLKQVDQGILSKMQHFFSANPIDVGFWRKEDERVKHDLNAFISERLRFLPADLHRYFHDHMTSYDTEEPAFLRMMLDSGNVVVPLIGELISQLERMALDYRYTVMMARTHGQEAQLQSFGKRCLSWLKELLVTKDHLDSIYSTLSQSKLSGAIGNYGGMDPNVEQEALVILGFTPFYGATQIIPRAHYAPLAQMLCQLVLSLSKIALDIRLGARSNKPIYQEPFSKKQKGSSAMPHKKNTILTEKIEGMARMAEGFLAMIQKNIVTWEERSIEQSCVERVAWPDIFHVVVHSLTVMTKVLEGLVVYPDHMLLEIINSCGCYAALEAKEFLRQYLDTEDAYRIVQLAAFNVCEPTEKQRAVRNWQFTSFVHAEEALSLLKYNPFSEMASIQYVIAEGRLQVSSQLEASSEEVERYNRMLKAVFVEGEAFDSWNNLFRLSALLKNEEVLYKEICRK